MTITFGLEFNVINKIFQVFPRESQQSTDACKYIGLKFVTSSKLYFSQPAELK